MDLFSVLTFIMGLASFLFGMNIMSSNLERMAGGKLEALLKKMTSNPIISLLLGAGITMVIQSSSATTVMLVGLVNSGIMSIYQTLYVIFGANIGTTITAWILSLAGIESTNLAVEMLKPVNFSPLLALIGILLIMLAKTDKKKSVGSVLMGFAVLMYGMEFMKDAVEPLAENPEFSQLLIKFNNPLLGVLIGIAVTAVIQSSSASVGILQALSLTGSITCGMAVPIIMGQNIGTCVTSLISSIGTKTAAKRVATIHLSIKIIGTVICLPVYLVVDRATGSLMSDIIATPFAVALIHTIFNLVITVILMPFSKLIIKLAEKIVKDKKEQEQAEEPIFMLDDLLLRAPSIAVNECNAYTVQMAAISRGILFGAFRLLDNYDEQLAKKIIEQEDDLDKLEDSLGTYLVKLSAQKLSVEDSCRISKMLHSIGDFERLGDHAVNLLKVAKEMHEKNISFSSQARQELEVLRKATEEILELTERAYQTNDVVLAGKVEPLEQVIDGLATGIRNNHIERLKDGQCTIELGFVLADTLTNYERISDHCSNIAVAIIELVRGSFDTHRYLNSIKYGEGDFSETFTEYAAKYSV